jgi:hypothetical protein
MDHYEGPHTPLTIVLDRGLYLVYIINGYGGLHTALTIAFITGLYIANIMDRYLRAPDCT